MQPNIVLDLAAYKDKLLVFVKKVLKIFIAWFMCILDVIADTTHTSYTLYEEFFLRFITYYNFKLKRLNWENI